MRERGFTLFELLTTLTIASLLLFIGLPALSDTMKQSRSRAIAIELTGLFSMARQAAVNTERLVTVCGSSDQIHCDRGWATGILVFVDGGSAGIVDGGDRVLRYHSPALGGDLAWRTFQNKPYVQYKPNGSTDNNGNLTYCPDNRAPALARQIIVNRVGRIRLAADSDGNGIANDAAGDDLSC
ncbi:GspH/FimT family protein [Gilvimarinus sp. F26214L]|uniref:GspH/FimT family protein n=1 Tax=Gilvimarinus sp. DZF01 TaxID=3461371 RepID=UPI0040461766